MTFESDDPGRLPSAHGAYRRIADHAEWLARVAPEDDRRSRDPAAGCLGPLDALMVALFLEYRGGRTTVVDLAAEDTLGASTLHCALQPGVSGVRIPHPDDPGVSPRWRLALEQHLREIGPGGAAPILPIGEAEPGERRVVLVRLGGDDRDEAERRLDGAMAVSGSGPILALGLGRVGRCRGLAALMARGDSGPGPGVSLFRELHGVVGASGLGLLAADDGASAEALDRIASFFTGNFDFLQLVEAHCRMALAVTRLDETTQARLQAAGSRDGFDGPQLVQLHLESLQERDRLRGEVDRMLGEIRARDQELQRLGGLLEEAGADRAAAHAQLAAIRGSRAHRMADRAGRLRRLLLREGPGGLVRRLVRQAG